jgi:hypothetical protein
VLLGTMFVIALPITIGIIYGMVVGILDGLRATLARI